MITIYIFPRVDEYLVITK